MPRTHRPRSSLFVFGKRRRVVLNGSHEPTENISMGVNFPIEMFKRLTKAAQKHKTSFSEQVRTYIEWGFMSEDQDDGTY